jgi:hypothetical protein
MIMMMMKSHGNEIFFLKISLLNMASISKILMIFQLWESPNLKPIYTMQILNEYIILRG